MDTKLRCLLLDDELPGLTYLKLLCEQIEDIEVVKAFNDSSKFLKESKSLDFDFCFLDIEVPGIKGIEVALLLDKPVIFVTAYKEYASDAFDIDAIDYIKKPIQKDRLEKAIQKVRRVLTERNQKRDFVQLNTDRGKALIYFDQVLHITTGEKDKRDKLLFLEDGKELTLKNISFQELIKVFPASRFCRVNKKDIIALNTVRFITNDLITTNIPSTTSKETVFVLGEIYRDDFLSKIN
jgi:two-component system, LytTR family, response regulator